MKKSDKSNKPMFPRLFCLIITCLTAIVGTVIKDWSSTIYFIGYTIMLFLITEGNNQATNLYYQQQIDELKNRCDLMEKQIKNKKENTYADNRKED